VGLAEEGGELCGIVVLRVSEVRINLKGKAMYLVDGEHFEDARLDFYF